MIMLEVITICKDHGVCVYHAGGEAFKRRLVHSVELTIMA